MIMPLQHPLRDWGFDHRQGEVTVLRHFPPNHINPGTHLLIRVAYHLFCFVSKLTESSAIFVQI